MRSYRLLLPFAPRSRSAAVTAVMLATLASGLPLDALAQARRGATAEDYFTFRFPSDPRLSPDGKLVSYVVSRVDKDRNRRMPSVWIVPSDGGSPRQLLDETWGAGAPRWSPDGKSVAFLSSHAAEADAARGTSTASASVQGAAASARAQLWVVSADGGAPRRLTTLANGVSNCAWSPDGARFACLTRTGPSDSLNTGPDRSDVRHYAQAAYKFNDTGWYDDKRTHVCVIDAMSGLTRQITSGDEWNDADPQWSPDATRIAFVSDRTGKEFDLGQNTDVWTISVAGGTPTKISAAAGRDGSPAWSPDGKRIAFVSSPAEDDPPPIFLAPAAGGAAVLATKALDLIPGALQWGDNGAALYFETGFRGTLHLFRVDLARGAVTQVTKGERAVRAVHVNAATNQIAFLANDFQHLDDVFVGPLDGKTERKLTDVNADAWKSLDFAAVTRLPYKGADGWEVDGFFVKPIGWVAGKKYPMVLSVHGGPSGQYGVDWFHEFQVYAAKGYAVFFANPRGSTGYGRAFQRGIDKQWGGKDYIDVMNGVRAAIAKNPWVDTTKLGVTGGSYGGYMTNWIVGHTGLFKAAVTLRSISNFISDDGTRDGAYGHKGDFGGDIFQQHDLFWDRSPLKYVKNVTTPILILHADNDFRVPIEQGEQWFRALRHFGKTAEIVFFPRENHNLTRTGEPRHIVESMGWQLYWFDKYLNGNSHAVPPDRVARVKAS